MDASLQQRIAQAQRASVNNSPTSKGSADGAQGGPAGDGGFPVQQDPGDWSGSNQPPMQPVQHGGAMPPQYMPQGGMTAPAGQPPVPSGMAYGAPPQAPQQQPQGYAPMAGPMGGQVPMGQQPPEGNQMMVQGGPYQMGDGSGQQQGGPQQPQAQLMYPGGYVQQPMPVMMLPNGQMMPAHGMQAMPNQQGMQHPGGMQFVMVQPGQQGMPQQMQQQGQMQGMPQQMQGMQAVAMNPDGSGGMVMMQGHGVPQGMATGPDHGKGVGQGVGPVDSMQDGKGSRQLGLSRNSQPKQGANWRDTQAAPRQRGGRPGPADFQQGRFDQPMDMMNQHNMGMMQPMDMGMQMGSIPGGGPGMAPAQMGFPGSPAKSGAPMAPPPNGGAEPSSPSQNRKMGTKMRNPAAGQKMWADIQDTHQGTLDQDLQKLWGGSQQASFGNDSPQPKHGGPMALAAGRGKSGRGKDGKGDGKGGDMRQDHGQQAKWVPTNEARPEPAGKGGKGKHQAEWAPKSAPPPKAPEPHLAIAGGKGSRGGGGGGAAGSGVGGGKQKPSKKDAQMEDWLSLRFAGQPPAAPEDSHDRGEDWGEKYDAGDDYYEDDGDGDTRRSKRKGKGGKGKAEEKRRDKGKGKGKSGRGGFWRSTS